MDAVSLFHQANSFYVDEDYSQALDCYSLAIGLDDSQPTYFVNRAACYIRTGNFSSAVEDANTALTLDSTCHLALYRKGVALFYQNEI